MTVQLNYKSKISPVVSTTAFKESALNNSQFFIIKENDFITTSIEYSNYINFQSYIYNIETLRNGFRVTSNTVDLIATDIVLDSVPYFYEIVLIGGYLSAEDLRLNSSIQFVEFKGHYYTNSIVVNQEITQNIYAYSKEVIEFTPKIKYGSKHIELTYTTDKYLYFKPKSETVINPILINDSKVYLPSFYVQRFDNKILKCIEGDIQLINKKEIASIIGNKIRCKDLIVNQEQNNLFYNKYSNSFYLDTFFFLKEEFILNYTAKKSSHIFQILETNTYFKIKNTGLSISDSSDYDFVIKKNINPYKLNITVSDFLTEYQLSFKPSNYILTKYSLSENDNVSFKKQVICNFEKNPSNVNYVQTNNKIIYQENNSRDIENISIVEDEDIENNLSELITTDYMSNYKKIIDKSLNITYLTRQEEK